METQARRGSVIWATNLVRADRADLTGAGDSIPRYLSELEKDETMWRLILLTALTLATTACRDEQACQSKARGLVDGDYWSVSTIEPHSLQSVRLIVVNSFECRICAELDPKMAALRKRYGDRLVVDYYDVITPQTKMGVAAHYILKNEGRGSELRQYLYSHFATLRPSDSDALDLLGRFGLDPNDLSDPAIQHEVGRRDRVARRLAEGTPTIIIEGQIAMQGDVGKISHVVDQLLANGRKE